MLLDSPAAVGAAAAEDFPGPAPADYIVEAASLAAAVPMPVAGYTAGPVDCLAAAGPIHPAVDHKVGFDPIAADWGLGSNYPLGEPSGAPGPRKKESRNCGNCLRRKRLAFRNRDS